MNEASAFGAFGDLIQPFQIETLGVRGRLVRLSAALEGVLSAHGYPGPVATLLSETLGLTVVLAGALKYQGVFTLQTQGDGPVPVMVADMTSAGDLRGYARFDAGRLAAAMESGAAGMENPVPRLLGAGHLAFTVDQGPDTERYQGITELTGPTLADCAHTYFRQSEQLQTAIMLAATAGGPGIRARSAALMIQRLPETAADSPGNDRDDDWRQAVALMSSLTRAELLDGELSPSDILYRLFHRHGIRVFRTRPLNYRCRCSRQKVAAALASFSTDEVRAMVEDGRITVTCEFCKTDHVFDAARLDAT